MSVQKITRNFSLKVNNEKVDLPDVNDELSVEDIKDIYSSQYPQLLNCKIEDKGINDEGVHEFEFISIAGTKG